MQAAEYMGTLNVTQSGKPCQAWASQFPHKHTMTDDTLYVDGSAALARNYCRNLDGEVGPWCYTTDEATRWELCDVNFCGKPSSA